MLAMASDLDGTLVFDQEFKEKDIEAIQSFREKGNLFGICSGRVLDAILMSTRGVIDCDFYIASSGSVIADRNLNILYASYIDFQTIKQLYEDYHNICAVFFQADGEYYNIYRNYGFDTKIIYDLDELKDKKHTGISFEFKEGEEEKARIVNEELAIRYPYLIGHQNKASIDITPRDCSKGNALLKVKELFHIDTIGGIGDSYNDLPMIQKADLGFTFTYAPESIQKQADRIVEHEYEALKELEEYHV